MTEKEEQLLSEAATLFKRNGIKSMTMDDIARALKVSKKTLYKYVKDKNDLVFKAVKLDLDKSDIEFEEVCKSSTDPIDELFNITAYASKHLKSLHPSVMYDMQRFHPEVWRYFEEHKAACIYESVLNNMNRGKEIGVYRAELNSIILAKLYVGRFDVMFNPELFPPEEFSFIQIHNEMMDYHLHGILTLKGLDILHEKKATKNDEK